MLSLFKRRRPEAVEQSTAIPPNVEAALEAATFHMRPGGEGDRVVVQIEGWRGFIHNPETCAKTLQAAFPELTEAQAQRGARFLASRVRLHARQVDAALQPEQAPWLHRY